MAGDAAHEVTVLRNQRHDVRSLRNSLQRAIAGVQVTPAGGWRGKTVLVKPNVLAAVEPARCVTTHPATVEAIATLFTDMGARVLVGDSSGGTMFGISQTRRALAVSGIAFAARRAGAELAPLEEHGVTSVPGRYGKWQIHTSALLEKIDAVVNVPVFKTHTATVLTGAVKNLFGLVPGFLKADYHRDIPHIPTFSRFLVDLADTVRPAINILDGIMCMQGNGPMNGELYHAGVVVVGRSPHAVDAVMERLAGLPPRSVPTVAAAARLKSFAADECLTETCSPLHGFRLPDTVPNGLVARFVFTSGVKWHRAYPRIDPKSCTACGECAAACPIEAIYVRRGTVCVDTRKCMRCLCCHELCRSGAVALRRDHLARRVASLLCPNV